MTLSMSNGGVCRTEPATPGLLIRMLSSGDWCTISKIWDSKLLEAKGGLKIQHKLSGQLVKLMPLDSRNCLQVYLSFQVRFPEVGSIIREADIKSWFVVCQLAGQNSFSILLEDCCHSLVLRTGLPLSSSILHILSYFVRASFTAWCLTVVGQSLLPCFLSTYPNPAAGNRF